MLDLDDLLLYWRALAPTRSSVATLEGRFDHVLIDEYQDVNGLQVDIVRGLRRDCQELTVVGDDFQAIYGWRAASVEHILGFPSSSRARTVINLERNYRSSAADPRRGQRARRSGRPARSPSSCGPSAKGACGRSSLFLRDESAQAVEVCDRVLAAREEGMELREQAVLFRTGHDSDLLELELTRRRSRSSSTAGCATSRRRTSRT